MDSEKSNSKAKTLGITAIAGLLVISAVVYALNNNNQAAVKEPEQKVVVASSPTPSPSVASAADVAGAFKDGVYLADGGYTSPGGPEQVGVALTLKDGIITEANVISKAERPNSKKFQGIFIENYKPLVVGKKLDEVQLDKVSGSSLTPKGFNDAVMKIKAQAS